MLKRDSIGADVNVLQSMLGIKVTGIFDENTYAAVVAAQKKFGLIADGIAGPKTLAALKGNAYKLLKMADIQRAAEALQVEEASILAVHQVESVGYGFLPDGRAKILYERHVMYHRLANAGIDAAMAMQKYPSFVNTARGGYLGNASEYARMGMAGQIDQQCAMESCSWGAYQIMGYHWQLLGYESVYAFVEEMQNTEGKHLDIFVRFIQADANLYKALKGRKWADFARLYNGPAYKDNFYDKKIAQAYSDAKKNLA